MTILAVNGLLDTASYPGTNVLMAMNRHGRIAWTALADGLLNIALSVVLVLRFGLAGVALATVISTVVIQAVSVVPYTTRTIGVAYGELARATLVPLLVPTAIFVAALLALRTAVGADSVPAVGAALAGAAVLYAARRFSKRTAPPSPDACSR